MTVRVDTPVAPNAKFLAGILPWQREFLTDVDTLSGVTFWLLEVHRRARKTTTVLNLLNRECVRYPNTRRIYISPTYAQSRTIVWDDPNMLKSYLPDQKLMGWRASEQRMQVRYSNGSVLELHGSDEPDRLRGIDFEDAGLDEGSVVNEDVLTQILMPILFQKPGRRLFITYTPKGMTWTTQMFDRAACIADGMALPTAGKPEKLLPGYYAYRLLASKSGIIPAAQLAEARRTMPKAMFDQEFECLRVTDEAFTLITSAMLEQLDRDPPLDGHKAIISCDPSLGGDECSIDVHRGSRVLERDSVRTRDPDLICAKLKVLSDKHRIYDFIIDSIGIGESVANPMSKDERYHVIRFVSSGASAKPEQFRNRRTDMWWAAMEEVRNQKVQYPPDEETRRQIPFASRYKPEGKTVQILSKQDIRKLLGRSPDRADSWAMARYGLPLARECMGEYMRFEQVLAGAQESKEWDPMDFVG